MKVGLVGSVGSSLLTLQKLYEYKFDIVGVWGYEPESIKNVSGYCSLKDFSEEHSLPYHSFVRINDDIHKKEIKEAAPELLFIVGLSQLVDKEIINFPKYGCVGLHPTKLPHGRGRAPLAWLVLNEKEGAATFFKIDESADSGDIYVQEPFCIEESDDVASVCEKLDHCMVKALDKWLPTLKDTPPVGTPQNENDVTCYARRAPLDGFLDFSHTGRELDRLIKSATVPHPGAFSFYDDYKVLIWKSKYHEGGYPKGVIGRVVDFVGIHPVIQTGEGFIELVEYEMLNYQEEEVDIKLVVGSRLGYYDQYEIFKLRNEIKEIKKVIKIQ